jgi:hypothetical protein
MGDNQGPTHPKRQDWRVDEERVCLVAPHLPDLDLAFFVVRCVKLKTSMTVNFVRVTRWFEGASVPETRGVPPSPLPQYWHPNPDIAQSH